MEDLTNASQDAGFIPEALIQHREGDDFSESFLARIQRLGEAMLDGLKQHPRGSLEVGGVALGLGLATRGAAVAFSHRR